MNINFKQLKTKCPTKYWAVWDSIITGYRSSTVVGIVKSRRVQWAGIAAQKKETKNAYRILLKEMTWETVKKWENIIKMNVTALPHFVCGLRNWLDNFPDRWVWRWGQISWPLRSPDLCPPPLYFYLWGCLKEKCMPRKFGIATI
jgi:hypothetical protein